MVSNIDATKPVQGIPQTASVRANFGAAKDEIESLQANGIEGLTTVEVDQLKNIGATTLSAGDWSVMAASTASYTTAEETKLAASAVLSSANAFTGVNTNTGQPAFLAFNSVTDANVTGNATVVTVDFDTEVFDQGGDFTGDTLTASVTGKYQLDANVKIEQISGWSSMLITISTSNRTYQSQLIGAATTTYANTQRSISLSVLADMDASDTVTVTVAVSGVGADTADIVGGSTLVTYFSGHLVA